MGMDDEMRSVFFSVESLVLLNERASVGLSVSSLCPLNNIVLYTLT